MRCGERLDVGRAMEIEGECGAFGRSGILRLTARLYLDQGMDEIKV